MKVQLFCTQSQQQQYQSFTQLIHCTNRTEYEQNCLQPGYEQIYLLCNKLLSFRHTHSSGFAHPLASGPFLLCLRSLPRSCSRYLNNLLLIIMEQEQQQQQQPAPVPQSAPAQPTPPTTEPAEPAEPAASQTRLYVSNLDASVSNRKTEADLREIFSKFGRIASVSVRRNEKHKKLYAFVEFGQPEEATEAVDNLHNSYFGDERIRVEYQRAQTREERRPAGRDMGNVTCFRCRQPGHFARDCQQKPDSQHRGRRREEERGRRRSRSRSHEKKRRQRSSSSSSSSSSGGKRRRRSSSSSSGSSR